MIESQQVTKIFLESMIDPSGAESIDHAKVQGLVGIALLSTSILEKYRDTVKNWLSQFESAFYESTGGGYTFLNLCYTADGEQWIGEQRVMNELVMLGIGLGLCDWLMFEMRQAFPDNVPYVVIKDSVC